MKDIFFVDQNGRIVYDIQGNSSFEVHNHSKGRDYTGVQLNLVRASLSVEVGVCGQGLKKVGPYPLTSDATYRVGD